MVSPQESELKPPTWLSEKSNHRETQSIQNAIIRFLYDSEDHSVIEDIKSMILPSEIWNCEQTTLFALKKLL